jgi:hypothetical protein
MFNTNYDMIRLILLIITTVLFSCTTKPREIKKVPNDNLIQNHTEISNHMTEDSLGNRDSLSIPSFEIEIVLSEKAKARMLSPKESIIVYGEFTGEPNDTLSQGLTEPGLLGLASFKLEIDAPWVTKIDKIYIPRVSYDRLKNKDYDVSIQIWTGRRSSEFNLLHGELVYGPISEIKGRRHKLNAKLIDE